MKLTRRQFIKTGFLGSLTLTLAGIGYAQCSQGSRPPIAGPLAGLKEIVGLKVLTGEDAVLIGALAIVLLDGSLPEKELERQRVLLQIAKDADGAIAGLPPGIQDEFKQLLALLKFPPSRRWLAGVHADWPEASNEDINTFLYSWRHSRFQLMRSGYQALHKIINGAWYSSELSWGAIGYPGPPRGPIDAQNDSGTK